MFFYIIIQTILFLFIINKYYEILIVYLLSPISKQNNINYYNFDLYENINNGLLFNNNNNLLNYPIYEINFDILNLTYIIYYIVIIYIIIYIIPLLLLQIYLYIKNSLFKNEKKYILLYIIIYFFLFFISFILNNYFNIYILIKLFFNTY